MEYSQIFEQRDSNKAFEEDIGVTGFGMTPVKGEGNATHYDTEQQAFLTRYNHVVYSLGFIITEEMIDDDQYDTVGSRRTEGLAFSMRQTEETVAANVLNRAFNPSFTGGDGSSLIASGYEHVESAQVGDVGVEGTHSENGVVSRDMGKGETAYLMRQRQDYFDEDQATKQRDIDKTVQSLRRDKIKSTESTDGSYGEVRITK